MDALVQCSVPNSGPVVSRKQVMWEDIENDEYAEEVGHKEPKSELDIERRIDSVYLAKKRLGKRTASSDSRSEDQEDQDLDDQDGTLTQDGSLTTGSSTVQSRSNSVVRRSWGSLGMLMALPSLLAATPSSTPLHSTLPQDTPSHFC